MIAEYQALALKTANYPKQHALTYLSLGLAGEAGEVANIAKKVIRDDFGVLQSTKKDAILDELGDVLWYVAVLAWELGVTLDDLAEHNIEKLRARYNK